MAEMLKKNVPNYDTLSTPYRTPEKVGAMILSRVAAAKSPKSAVWERHDVFLEKTNTFCCRMLIFRRRRLHFTGFVLMQLLF